MAVTLEDKKEVYDCLNKAWNNVKPLFENQSDETWEKVFEEQNNLMAQAGNIASKKLIQNLTYDFYEYINRCIKGWKNEVK